jgi:CRP/FNR family transcriptional regulator
MSKTDSIGCTSCPTRHVCLPQDLNDTDLRKFNESVKFRKNVKKGDVIISAGSVFHSIFIIRTGSFKTFLNNENGYGHLTGFLMAGNSMGFDGIGKSKYSSDATALEDSSVCVVPFPAIEVLSRKIPIFQHRFLQVMSNEILRENENSIIFPQMRADQKVANFIYDLLAKLKFRGFSEKELNLKMTRHEIGQHLGLSLETISRSFSKLAKQEVLTINGRHVTIIDKPSLELICQFK